MERLVERFTQRIVALAHDEARRRVEAWDVDRDLQLRITAGIVLRRLEIEEMRIPVPLLRAATAELLSGNLTRSAPVKFF
jgi:hypothetical protein